LGIHTGSWFTNSDAGGHPDISQADAARRLKVSTRTVARHWTASGPDNQPDRAPVDGEAVPALAEAIAT